MSSSMVWADWIWLPPNYTWKNLENGPGEMKAQPFDLWMSLPAGAVLLCVRWLLECVLLRPLAASLLQAAAPKLPSGRRKRLSDKKVMKFSEVSWQLIYYSCSVTYGLWLLWGEPYLTDTTQLWTGWPNLSPSTGMRFYYIVQLGFYVSALVTVFGDSWRKDSWQMAFHHLLTIFLMWMSWSVNFYKVGALVLLLHDLADPLLNLSKIGNYLRIRYISDPAFTIFAIIWVVTRLILFPLTAIRSCLMEMPVQVGASPVMRSLTTMLILMEVLHYIWTYYIGKITVTVLCTGQRSDSRSDSEGSEDNSGKAD